MELNKPTDTIGKSLRRYRVFNELRYAISIFIVVMMLSRAGPCSTRQLMNYVYDLNLVIILFCSNVIRFLKLRHMIHWT